MANDGLSTRKLPPGMPRWVKALLAVSVLLVVAVIVLHATGNGMFHEAAPHTAEPHG
ncbi:MAG: hypothetical protein KIS96_08735 [Bauldia sp.]|nr:hypothetical protein [Bauldia sp.]